MNLNVIQVYAPTSETADEIEEFYIALEEEILRTPTREMTMVLGDFNAKVGSLGPTEDHLRRVLGRADLGERNERRERLLSFCAERELTIANTTFTHHPRRLYTWRSPGDRYRNQIDFILVPQRWRTSVRNARTYPGAECGSYHQLLVGEIRLKPKTPNHTAKTRNRWHLHANTE